MIIDGVEIHNTDIESKRKYWPKFAKFMENQFEFGGTKYAMDGQEDKEATDWCCEIVPGKTGVDGILWTAARYIGRFKNFKRERDLFKIATYCFIMWLKMGFHLQDEHDQDVNKEKKDVEELDTCTCDGSCCKKKD